MRDSCVFYRAHKEAIKACPIEYRAQIYEMVFDYMFDDILPEYKEGFEYALFLSMKPNIDRSKARYKASIENGERGGRPPKNNPDKTQNSSDETKNNPDKTKNSSDETKNNPDKTKNSSDKTQNNLDEIQNSSDEIQNNLNETKNNLDKTQNNLNETKNNLDKTKVQPNQNLNDNDNDNVNVTVNDNVSVKGDCKGENKFPPHTHKQEKNDCLNNSNSKTEFQGNTKKSKIKKAYGSEKNVFLTDEQHAKLESDYGSDLAEMIEYLSDYIAKNGGKTKKQEHNRVLRNWVKDAIRERKLKQQELELREKELKAREKRLETGYLYPKPGVLNSKKEGQTTSYDVDEYENYDIFDEIKSTGYP